MLFALMFATFAVDVGKPAEDVPLATLGHMPEMWHEKVVRTCGLPSPVYPDVIYVTGTLGITYDPKARREKVGGQLCVTGVVERKDRLTKAQVVARGMGVTVYADMYNPTFIIRPIP